MMLLSKLIPLGFLLIGVFLLMQVILPVASFKMWELGQSSSDDVLLVSPSVSKGNQVLGVSIQKKDNFPAFISTLSREARIVYREFTLTIPKLKIDKVLVLVDSNDLSKGLVHLPGTALPGERGNVFISGHSALSRIFNLQTAQFAALTNLKKGDEIVLEANGAQFKYEVIGSKVVDPKDLSVVNSPESLGRYVTLMTCVPPGLNFKRLVVLGKMI